jgi:hypothetical protein
MRARRGTYTTYSIACFAVWALIFLVGVATGSHRPGHPVLYVFGGWVIGWTSATIARAVYPPPRRRRKSSLQRR